MEFIPFPKIHRISRPCVVTEKIDGTNACICITKEGEFLTGSRTKWITPSDDNHGFSKWAHENKDELLKLGIGCHHGEWWGQEIQRTYGLKEKRFSLFNTSKWLDPLVRPKCCHIVPVLYEGLFDTVEINKCLDRLAQTGSIAAPNFMKPEGIVIFHVAGNFCLKKTLNNDGLPKSLVKEEQHA
jgi:hypothetical protein